LVGHWAVNKPIQELGYIVLGVLLRSIVTHLTNLFTFNVRTEIPGSKLGRMSLRKERNPGAICFRIILFATLMAIMGYGAATPSEMYKVRAECVMIGVAGLSMVVQAYVTLAVYGCCSICLP
jgi:hypothetical protein